jgi:hypothetical protein
MTTSTTTTWEPAAHLTTPNDVAAYLEAALQDKAPELVSAAPGDIAKAKGMSQVARDAGLGWGKSVQVTFLFGQSRVSNHIEGHLSAGLTNA